MKQPVQKVLIAYSTVLSSAIMILLLTGAKSQRNESFDTIQVFPESFQGNYIAGYLVLEHDSSEDVCFARHDLRPMGHEISMVAGWKCGHTSCLRVELLFEKSRKIAFFNRAQLNFVRRGNHGKSQYVASVEFQVAALPPISQDRMLKNPIRRQKTGFLAKRGGNGLLAAHLYKTY